MKRCLPGKSVASSVASFTLFGSGSITNETALGPSDRAKQRSPNSKGVPLLRVFVGLQKCDHVGGWTHGGVLEIGKGTNSITENVVDLNGSTVSQTHTSSDFDQLRPDWTGLCSLEELPCCRSSLSPCAKLHSVPFLQQPCSFGQAKWRKPMESGVAP